MYVQCKLCFYVSVCYIKSSNQGQNANERLDVILIVKPKLLPEFQDPCA